MEPELEAIVAFREQHDDLIRRLYRACHDELGFDLPLEVFSLRLYEAVEATLAEEAAARRPAARLLQALHHADLFHAAAALEGDMQAIESLGRWYGSPLRRRLPTAGAIIDRLLESRGPSSPLSRYLGLSPLSSWLAAAVARDAPAELDRARSVAAPQLALRRALDTVPARALAARAPAERVAVTLALLGDVAPDGLSTLLDRSPARCRALLRQLAAEVGAGIDEAMRGCGLDRRRRARSWKAIARSLRLESARASAVSEGLLRNSLRRELGDDGERCPEIDLVLAAAARLDGVDRTRPLEHAAGCWGCLSSIRASLDGAAPGRGRRRWALAAAAALVIALTIAGARGLLPLEPPAALWARAADWLGSHGTASAPAPVVPPTAAEIEAAAPPTAATTPPRRAGLGGGVLAATPPLAPTTATPRSPPRTPPPAVTRPSLSGADATPTLRPPPAPTPPPAATTAALAPVEPTPRPAASTAPPPTPAAALTSPGGRPTPPRPSTTPTVRQAQLQRAAGQSRAAQLVNLALDRYRVGEEQNALEVLQRAVQLDPTLDAGHLASAVMLDRLGRPADARHHWKRYLDLAPAGDAAEAARDRLSRRP